MSYESIYTAEYNSDSTWSVINETSFTGHTVLTLNDKGAAVLYAELMNEVYNQVKVDVEKGTIKFP